MEQTTHQKRPIQGKKWLVIGGRAVILFGLTMMATLLLRTSVEHMHFLSLSTCFIYLCAYMLPTLLGGAVYIAAFAVSLLLANVQEYLGTMLLINAVCAIACSALMMLYRPGKPYRMAVAVAVGTLLYAGGWFLYNVLHGDTLNTLLVLMLDMVEWFANAGAALLLLEVLRFIPPKVRVYLDADGIYEKR